MILCVSAPTPVDLFWWFFLDAIKYIHVLIKELPFARRVKLASLGESVTQFAGTDHVWKIQGLNNLVDGLVAGARTAYRQ